jgi:hypothetical protein
MRDESVEGEGEEKRVERDERDGERGALEERNIEREVE